MIEVIKKDNVPDFCHKTPYSAGYDLYACLDEPVDINPLEIKLIDSGIRLNMLKEPYDGICALVLPRSGMSLKTNLRVCNSPGLCDADYQGNIKIIIQNIGSTTERINPLDRIAQLVFITTKNPEIKFVDKFDVTTERGTGGFGSTGK